jgi:hypothetical protein
MAILFHFRHVLAVGVITCGTISTCVRVIHAHGVKAESREAIYNLFAAYIHTIPLKELLESVERARRDAYLNKELQDLVLSVYSRKADASARFVGAY